MKIFLFSLPLLCLFFLPLQGCSSKNYPMPDQGILSEKQIQEHYSLNRQWWKLYGDQELDRIVDMALERNIDLARSAVTVNKALYQARQLGAELVPSFSGSGDGASRKQLDTGNTSRSFNASLGLSYELDLWGHLRDSASAQAWEYTATEQDLLASRLALVNSVVNTWYSMARTAQAIRISQENLHFYEQLLDIIQQKFHTGKTDGLDPAQAEQSLLAQQTSLLTLEEQFREEKQLLRDLLNMRPEEEPEYALPELADVKIPLPDLEIPIAAMGARPDVQAAESRIQKAFRTQQASRSSLYPSISVGGTLGASSNSLGNLFPNGFINGLLSLNLPFLDWNRVRWNVRISEAEFQDAVLNFQKTLTTALNEVSLYYQSMQNAQQQLTVMEKQHEADLRVQEYRKMRYDLGADELKDWLEALHASNSSQLSVLNDRYQVIAAANAIYQAMGGRITAHDDIPSDIK
jgi:NodT family efflux transporter outer membrane factor (OMF) lipoprotein